MTGYDHELVQLQQSMALKTQLEAQLKDLREQRRVFDRKMIQLRAAYGMEQEDVKKLEGRSLANYFYRFIGKLDSMLTEERRQAAAAKVKLDSAQRELVTVDGEIQKIQSQLQRLHGCDSAYAAAMEKKRAQIQQAGASALGEILTLEEQIAFLNSQKKEIQEAAMAGRKAMGTTETILSELYSAEKLNNWDMLGGDGVITHMVKHSHLDDAQNMVEVLQGQLRKFQTELADINIKTNMQVNIDGFLRFADYFFDGLFTDWSVRERISQSQTSVITVRCQIDQALKKLAQMEQGVDQQIAMLQAKIEELVIHG